LQVSGPSHLLSSGNTGRNLESVRELLASSEASPAATAPPALTLRQLLGCSEREAAPRYGQRGDYWVLYNYVQAEERTGCADAITYTTHGDHTFLDNLAPLLERWQGPVSMSVFAPGADWAPAMAAIQHVRHCSPRANLVRRWVTFHLYFPSKHVPKKVGCIGIQNFLVLFFFIKTLKNYHRDC
jgi:beta-1,4-glucuronyltransferase 1